MIYDEQIVNTVSLCVAAFLCSAKHHSIVIGIFCGGQKMSFIHPFNPFTVIWGSSPNLKKTPLDVAKSYFNLKFHSHVVDCMWKK